MALFRTTTAHEWRLVGTGTLAQAKLALGYTPAIPYRSTSGKRARYTALRIVDIANGPQDRKDPEGASSIPCTQRRGSACGSEWGAWPCARSCSLSGEGAWTGHRRVRGAEMATARELRRRVRPLSVRLMPRPCLPAARRSSCRIAGIPWPKRAETQHTMVSGTTGSGKTVLILDLVARLRARGERCILYDKMGSYTRSFFDPARDVLRKPLDARAPRWSPFFEAQTPRDFDMMAAALIPQQKDTVDPFWVTAARQLFANGAGGLWKQGETWNRVLVDHLLKTDLTSLAQKPWRARWPSPSWTRTTQRPRCRSGPCSPRTWGPWSSCPIRGSPSRSGTG